MAITSGNLLTEVQGRTLRTDVTNISDEIAAIMYEICNRGDVLERVSLVAISANAYSGDLPSGYKRIIAVLDSNSVGLDPVSMPELTANINADSSSATVQRMYSIFNDDLYVWPKPSANATFSVYNIYESTDTTILPAHFDECIIEGVCFKVYEGKGLLGEVPAASTHKENYESLLEALIARYKTRINA